MKTVRNLPKPHHAKILFVLVMLGASAATMAASAEETPGITIGCGYPPKQVTRPVDCPLLPGDESFTMGSDLQRLKWKHWGSSEATATGVDGVFDERERPTPVTVTAYRIRNGRYTRLREVGVRRSSSSMPASEVTVQRLDVPNPSISKPVPFKPSSVPQAPCADHIFDSAGYCASDPGFRALCSMLYALGRAGSRQDFEQYGRLDCDQPY